MGIRNLSDCWNYVYIWKKKLILVEQKLFYHVILGPTEGIVKIWAQ